MNRYIALQSLNSWATSVSAVIATNSMLNTITEKPSTSSVIGTTYIGKDIIGQLGGMVFVLKTGKKADLSPLKYISRGVFLQQVAFLIDNTVCLIEDKRMVLPLLGFSSFLKNISFISIGAVNTNTLQKIATNNIGEAYSKIASFNTLSSSLGMATGIGIINWTSYEKTFFFIPCLGFISFFSLRKSVYSP